MARFLKTTNNEQYSRWDVVDNAGQFTMVSEKIFTDGSKMIQINYFSGSTSSAPPVGPAMTNNVAKWITNPTLEEITEEEYTTNIDKIFNDLKNNFPTP